jgi:hypothetical protein
VGSSFTTSVTEVTPIQLSATVPTEFPSTATDPADELMVIVNGGRARF